MCRCDMPSFFILFVVIGIFTDLIHKYGTLDILLMYLSSYILFVISIKG